jgi:hypothetical protein
VDVVVRVAERSGCDFSQTRQALVAYLKSETDRTLRALIDC